MFSVIQSFPVSLRIRLAVADDDQHQFVVPHPEGVKSVEPVDLRSARGRSRCAAANTSGSIGCFRRSRLTTAYMSRR